jgi:hypothetical protein
VYGEQNCLKKTAVLLTPIKHGLRSKMTDVRKVRLGSEPLLQQVSPEVGSGVHMILLGAVPPRHLASHWSRRTCAFQPSCYLC